MEQFKEGDLIKVKGYKIFSEDKFKNDTGEYILSAPAVLLFQEDLVLKVIKVEGTIITLGFPRIEKQNETVKWIRETIIWQPNNELGKIYRRSKQSDVFDKLDNNTYEIDSSYLTHSHIIT